MTTNLFDQDVSSTGVAKVPFCFTPLFCVERVWCDNLETDIVPVLSSAMSPWPGIPHLLYLLFLRIWKVKPICAPNKKKLLLSSLKLTLLSLLWKSRQWDDSGFSSLPSNGTFWVPACTDTTGGLFSETSLKHVSPQCSVSLAHVLFSVEFWKLFVYLTRLLCYCTRLQHIVLHWLPLTGLDCTNSGILFASEKHVKTFLLRA